MVKKIKRKSNTRSSGKGDEFEIDHNISDYLSDDTPEENILYKKRRRINDDSEDQWIEKYTPLEPKDICINPRKLNEVSHTLKLMISGDSLFKLLVVTGPSGCSKSTTIKLLSETLVADYKRAIFPNISDNSFAGNGWVEYLETSSPHSLQSLSFQEFLSDAKYRTGANLSVIIIEELPNIFHLQTLENFRNGLKQWLHIESPLPPLVLCITEVEVQQELLSKIYFDVNSSITAETLLGPQILGLKSSVKQIKFGPIAYTFMKKTLTNIVMKEKDVFREIPSEPLQKFIGNLISSGDIRSAVCNLQIWAKRFSNINFYSFSKESHLNLFHALGKVIYSSSKYKSLDDDEKNYLSVNEVLESYNNVSLLNLSILENFASYNSSDFDLEIASSIIDSLSIGDVLGELDEGRQYGIRSVRRYMSLIPHRGAQKGSFNFPRHFKMLKAFNDTRDKILAYRNTIDENKRSFEVLNMLDGFYLPIILNHRFENQRFLRYGRLGGQFQYLTADDEMPLNEGESKMYPEDQFSLDIEARLQRKIDLEMNKSAQDESSQLTDPIETDFDSDDQVFNDSIDEGEINRLVSQTKSQSIIYSSEEVFLSDSELEVISRQL